MTTASGSTRAKGERLARGTLTPDVITTTALDLLDAEGVGALSMPRLGRKLGASSTAVYRHFPNRDEVVLGVADALIGEALDGFEPVADWVDTLRDLGWRIWETCERHPAAMSLTYMRTTRRPNEMRAVEAIMAAVLAGGWHGRQAVLAYRGYASFVLSIAGAGATFMSLPEMDRAGDQSAWPRVYGHLDARDYPHLAEMAPHMGVEISPREIFELQLELYLRAVSAGAPGAAPAKS